MKKNITIILSGLAILLLAVCCSKVNEEEPKLTPKDITLSAAAPIAIQSSNEFGIELFTRVAESENKNLMLSPLSASTALTMLLNGCGGDTYSQLQGTLKYPAEMSISEINEAYKSLVGQLLTVDPRVQLAFANAIFYRNGFNVKPPFLATMNDDYKATVKALDFATPTALTTINKWASDNTKGKIPEVLSEIPGDAVMFIMNALYFNGDWSYQFDKSMTQELPFHPDGGSATDVPTMKGKVGAKFARDEGFRAIEMPYGQTNFTMVVIVPDETLSAFYPSFTYQVWDKLCSDLDELQEFDKTTVIMPKFKFSYEKYLNNQLMSMGMIDAFSSSDADLSGISDSGIWVDYVQQNTFVEVDEEGTETAAVTTIDVGVTSPLPFNIYKSFIFAIRERTTNTLLFIGQVVNPEQG
ncbi:MAG: serpin family protein [Bacteroidales bacterium]|jgi:serine protease inhibitor